MGSVKIFSSIRPAIINRAPEKGSNKNEFSRFKSEDRKIKDQNKSDISKISQNDVDSVNEVTLF